MTNLPTLVPVLSEKAVKMAAANQWTFVVPATTTKEQVRNAAWKQLSVKALEIRLLTGHAKPARTVVGGGRRRITGRRAGFKKAYIRLAPDVSLPYYNDAGHESATALSEGDDAR